MNHSYDTSAASLLAQFNNGAHQYQNHYQQQSHVQPQQSFANHGVPAQQQPSFANHEAHSAQQPSPAGAAQRQSVEGQIKRNAYTDAMKAALRAEYRKEPKPTQRSLKDWFFRKYGMRINQSTVSVVLNDEHTDLDTEAALNSQVKRHRAGEFPELEEKLYEWQQQTEEQGTHVNGDMIREQGSQLWDTMECYRDKPKPMFSNGWLAGYKARMSLPMKHRSSKRKSDAVHTPQRAQPPPAWEPDQTPAFVAIPAARQPPYSYHPRPAYRAGTESPIRAHRPMYERIAGTVRTRNARIQTHTHTLAPRTGHAFKVPAGCIVRISTPSGAQVGELNIWNMHNPRERFWAARTRQLHSSHVRVLDRMWSCLPYLRPMATIIADTLAGYGVDGRGGRCHDLLGTRCDPYMRKIFTKGAPKPIPSNNVFEEDNEEAPILVSEEGAGDDYDFHCHSNIVRAIMLHGLGESDVHDSLSIFQVSGLDMDGRYFVGPCPAHGDAQSNQSQSMAPSSETATYTPAQQRSNFENTPAGPSGPWNYGNENGNGMHVTSSARAAPSAKEADHIELFAEMDLLMALSSCPGGCDPMAWDYGRSTVDTPCHELKVEVFKFRESTRARALDGWKSWKSARENYKGCHGLQLVTS